MIFFTDRFVPDGFAGYHYGPLVFIRPAYRDDAGLIAHEETHVAQFWRLPILHMVLYRWSAGYRLDCEIEAYREQLKHSPQHLRLFAEFVATKYALTIDAYTAQVLLEAP